MPDSEPLSRRTPYALSEYAQNDDAGEEQYP